MRPGGRSGRGGTPAPVRAVGLGLAVLLAGAGLAGSVLAKLPPLGEEARLLRRLERSAGKNLRWRLPDKLEEISGLAATPDGRLLAHEDQNGIVYELDWREGRLVKAFALGDPTVRGDFEGITVAGDEIYLVTSNGRVYETHEAGDGERVRFHVYDTGVEEQCREVEGLAWDARARVLLLACKRPRGDEAEGFVWIHRWSPGWRAPADPPAWKVPARSLRDGDLDFRPSGLAWDADTGHLLVLSSKTRSVAELGPDGRLVGHLRLPPEEHRQAEGLALLPDGSLAVADEAAGERPRLAVYPPRRGQRAER